MQIARAPISFRQAQIQHRVRVMALDKRYITCPLCGLSHRPYKWKLYKTAIDCLALYYKLGAEKKPVSSTAVVEQGHTGKGDEAHLQDFGLLRKIRTNTGRSYHYMLTELGVNFLNGKSAIPEEIWLFGKHNVVSTSEKTVKIHECVPEFVLEDHLRNEM